MQLSLFSEHATPYDVTLVLFILLTRVVLIRVKPVEHYVHFYGDSVHLEQPGMQVMHYLVELNWNPELHWLHAGSPPAPILQTLHYCGHGLHSVLLAKK